MKVIKFQQNQKSKNPKLNSKDFLKIKTSKKILI